MASSNATTSKMTVDEEALDPVLSSIRKVEAIRDFATDITPLRSDGFNLHSWVGEIDKTLSDLIDRERYLRGCPPEPLVKSEDKIARNLIYWTIPRELRSLINDTITAHDAFKALQAQFLRNTRTSHMASLVDLFNFQMDVTEPHHITMVYDQMYKGMNELVASGFVINEDTLLGALFQIAVGRANSQLYTATSYLLDAKFSNNQQAISSHDVCAAARRQLEQWKNTIFDEGPMVPPSETMESFDPHADEEATHITSTNAPYSSMDQPGSLLPTANPANQRQPVEKPTLPEQSQQLPAAGSSSVDPSFNPPIGPADQSSPANQAGQPATQLPPTGVPDGAQATSSKPTQEPTPPSNPDPASKRHQANPLDTAAGSSPVPSLFGLNHPPAPSSTVGGAFKTSKHPGHGGQFSSSKSSTLGSTTGPVNSSSFGPSKPDPASPATTYTTPATPSTKPDRK